VSLPFKGSAATKWNTYGYDSYDRLVRLSEASGKQTTYSYSGNSVTTTEKGISTTRTNNAVGELVKVSDSSGEAVYHYRADGQLSDIVAPGNVVTSFEYDVYGRKTKLVDPSAGTQTYTETNHTNGSRTTTQTDAKGLTTTVNYDAYGRVTSVNRPEFNTSYTYDAVTKKLKSEVSTNGTKKEYTSDVYGSNAGSLSYMHASKPYAVTGAGVSGINQTFAYNVSGDRIEKNDSAQQRLQQVTYNSLMRPTTLTEGGNTATFLYGASGNRKKMTVTQSGTVTQTKYYLDDQ